MPFQDALDLVRSRKVYLLAGNAYIPHQEIVTIVLNDFRTRLSKALAVSNICEVIDTVPHNSSLLRGSETDFRSADIYILRAFCYTNTVHQFTVINWLLILTCGLMRFHFVHVLKTKSVQKMCLSYHLDLFWVSLCISDIPWHFWCVLLYLLRYN